MAATLVAMTGTPTYGQDAADSTAAWKTNAIVRLAGSQVGFQNWQGGGVNSVAFSAGLDGTAERASGRLEQKHTLKLALGAVKQGEEDLRKAEDAIIYTAAFLYLGEGFFAKFNPTFGAELRTQFTEGFNCDEDPIDGTREPPVKVSEFFAPAYLLQTIGLTYKPAPWITETFGLAAKETIVTIDRFQPLYGNDPGQTVRFEAGLVAKTDVERELAQNVFYKGGLSLFASFNKPDTPDIIWENLLTLKGNDWLNVGFEFVMLFDRDVTNEAQLKEVLSIGISFVVI